MVRSCYANRFNPQQLYEVGIVIVPIFQMRTNEAASISRAGPRSHREEIEEIGLSASNTCALSTEHPFPSIPTASLQVSISRPQSRSTLSGEGRTPRTQDMTMRWPLSQQQEMQDHLAAMETGGTVSADSLASHLLQLQSRIMPFNFQLLA